MKCRKRTLVCQCHTLAVSTKYYPKILRLLHRCYLVYTVYWILNKGIAIKYFSLESNKALKFLDKNLKNSGHGDVNENPIFSSSSLYIFPS